jgi:DNA invertase Pin-like site-specific DNA recombinase
MASSKSHPGSGNREILERSGFLTLRERGKRHNRPRLVVALAVCRRRKATVVIAKLDRLARNVHFISGLLETGINFVATDCPNDDRFMLHIRAAVAEDEARKISNRTKAAPAAANGPRRRTRRPPRRPASGLGSFA